MNKIVNFLNFDNSKDITKIVFAVALTVCTNNSRKMAINSKKLFKSLSLKEGGEFYNVRKYFTILNFDQITPNNSLFDYSFIITSSPIACDILICAYDLEKNDFAKIKSSFTACFNKKTKTYILLLNYDRKYIKVYSEIAKTYDHIQLFSFSKDDISKMDTKKLIDEKIPLSN
jgi:hypothetical protein